MLRQLRRFAGRLIRGSYLPCTVLCRDPLVVVAFDRDFTKAWPDFRRQFARFPKVYLFLQLGWQHETPEQADPFAADLKSIQADCPQLQITVLANTPAEVEALGRHGIDVIFCHQNAFLDERRYPILPRKKRYDAIYIARVTPFKRHYLARDIDSLRLIGDFSYQELAYVEKTLAALPQAAYTRSVPARQIPGQIAEGRCGLCLSAEEGAMFCCAEYLLCGRPIVNTANRGGRDIIVPAFACRQVPDDPAAVAAAVADWAAEAPPPEAIRAAILENMNVHREIFRRTLNRILLDHHRPPFHGPFPHKLALRLTRLPWDNLKYGLKR